MRPAVRLTTALRRLLRRSGDDLYGGRYYGAGRDPLSRMGLSGYERYDRQTSNADAAAYVVWSHFPANRVLDVGCATGFVVEALRELGVDAEGVDVSRYAIEHAAPGARDHIRTGSLLHTLPYPDGSFDVVTALETLEHLPPDSIPPAARELQRVTSGWVVATIPSFGPNDHGPGGWFEEKVRDDLLLQYQGKGLVYDGPVPFEDLKRDVDGAPLEGHLTVASFRWWAARFEEVGLVRCGEMERRIHPVLTRFGLTRFWNLYVFRRPETPVPPAPVRTPAERAERERAWGLDRREASQPDLEFLRSALGDEAVADALRRPASS